VILSFSFSFFRLFLIVSLCQSNIERWNNIRRDAKGNIPILVYGVCMFFYQYNGGPIPKKLQGISIRSIIIDNVLVHQVEGWLTLAKAVLPDKMQAKYKNSLGAELMGQMTRGGSVHDKSSDAFGDMHTVVRNRILNDNTSIIAVHDHRLPDLSFLNRIKIRALRILSNARNTDYKKIYMPGYFVNGGTEKLSVRKVGKIVGGNFQRILAFCAGLRDEFNAQATDNRVEGIFARNQDEYLVSYGLQSP
jgi:hypothetical protein